MWTGFFWLEMGPVAGTCEHCNEKAGILCPAKQLNYPKDHKIIIIINL